MGSLLHHHALLGAQGVSFEPESLAYFAVLTGSYTDSADKVKFDNLIKAIKSSASLPLGVNNLSTAFHYLYVHAFNLNSSIRDVITLSSLTESTTDLIYVSKKGVYMTSGAEKLGTFNNEDADLDDFEFGSYISDLNTYYSSTDERSIACGAFEDSNAYGTHIINSYNLDGTFRANVRCFGSNRINIPSYTREIGLYNVKRTNLSSFSYYVNNVLKGSQTETATSRDELFGVIGAQDETSVPYLMGDVCAFSYAGKATQIDSAALNTAISNYLSTL